MLSISDGKTGFLGDERVRHTAPVSPEAWAVVVAVVLLLALVF
jgi:hypothetical protein